jgi:hypothetical protein
LLRLRQLIADIPRVAELDPFVCALGVPDAIEAKRSLSKAIHAGLLDEISSLQTELGRLSVSSDRLREKTIAQRLVIYKRLKAKAEMYQDLLGMQQDQVRAGIAGLEREAFNLLAVETEHLTSSDPQPSKPIFAEAGFAAD